MIRIACLLALLAVSAAGAVNPATTTAAPASPDNDLTSVADFRPLFLERETLVERLRELEVAIDELTTKIRALPPIATLEKDLQRAQRDLAKLQKAANPDAQALESLQRYIDTTGDNIQTLKTATPALQEQKGEYDRKSRRLFAVEQRIASLFDNSRDVNHFRTNATYTFGGMVFFVVIGFYLIAWKKEGVAATIFAGEMGMQFVTLFLIVIAIIMFGIMGTLEGRELAALLGGLSGYILGRTSTGKKPAQPVPAAPEAQPVPATPSPA